MSKEAGIPQQHYRQDAQRIFCQRCRFYRLVRKIRHHKRRHQRALDALLAEGRYDLARALAADEVVAMSTLKEVVSVAAIGHREWESTRWASKLRAAFRDLVAAEAESG